MPHVTHGLIDHSGETSTTRFYLPDITAANYDQVTGNAVGQNVGELRIAVGLVSEANFTRHTVISDVYAEAGTPPANPYAQRELKALFTCVDLTTNKKFTFTVSAPDLTNIAQQGTDVLDLTSNLVLSDFVSRVEGNAVSPDGNAFSIIAGRIVGRNN